MSTLDPRTPVLVGGGQLSLRDGAPEPVDMIVQAAHLAAEDARAPALVERLESARIVGMLSWRYRDPGLLVAERLGASARHTVYTGAGGSHPQALVNDAAEDIAAGRCDVVLVGGAEAWRTRMALKARGERPDWTVQGEDVAPDDLRPEVSMRDETEIPSGLDRPAHVYPLFEQALRASLGRTSDLHRKELGRLWSGFSQIASTNPHAWVQRQHSAEEIVEPGSRNRMVCWPYTKLMNSNNSVEQAAAVLICSVAAARAAGVPEDRWVFLRSGAEAAEPSRIAEREHLHRAPAIGHAGRLALQLADVPLDGLGPVDLYSCFPVAVQVAAAELGLAVDDVQRPLTITGGLTFAGGPWNNYTSHAIAAMVAAVRETGQPGLVTGNSGYLTKHSIGVYAPTPGAGFRRGDAQPDADREPRRRIAVDESGPGVLEACTVLMDRDGVPERAMAAVLRPDGARSLLHSTQPELMSRVVDKDLDGVQVLVGAEGRFDLA